MYYLHHYFDPDFSHLNLVPEQDAGGSVSQRYLGYVHNVVAGQVLAELINLDDYPNVPRDSRFTYQERYLPVGPNCAVHPNNPDKIISLANGYCFYHDGLITVKRLLNVRGNVGFHTGNIVYVGDVAVHGDVQTGFSVQARNVLVRGHIESAKVKSVGDLVCSSGVKGANTSLVEEEPSGNDLPPDVPDTLVAAGGNIRLPFCEHAQIRAQGDLVIDGHCLHSTLYVGGNLLVKGRLQGGAVYANRIVCVEGQLGGDYTSATRIYMGYNPFDYLSLQKIESQIKYLRDKLMYFEKLAGRNEVMEQEYQPRVDLARRKLRIAHSRRNELWRKFAVDEEKAMTCRILVPGKVMPGVEISIARAYTKIHSLLSDHCFMLGDDEIIERSPAVLPRKRKEQTDRPEDGATR